MTREREKMKGYRPRGPETSEGLKIPNVTSSIIVDTPKEHQEHYEKDTEIEILEERLRHLLSSKLIREYDAKDNKGNYKKDINELDKIDCRNYESIIAINYYLMGKLSVMKEQMMLYEQLGYLKAKNEFLNQKNNKPIFF